MRRVDRDLGRFRSIVRGEVRRNLKQYAQRGDLVAREGGRTVRVPLPEIRLPRFVFGDRGGGVGQGEGQPGDGVGEAGEAEGEHEIEVEVTLEELAQILGEELELPRIKPRGTRNVEADLLRYRSIRRAYPQKASFIMLRGALLLPGAPSPPRSRPRS